MSKEGWVIWGTGAPERRPKKMVGEVGNDYFRKIIFACEVCDEEMWNYVADEDICYCPKCAFKKGIITDKEYLAMDYYWANFKKGRAVVIDGEIYTAFDNEKFPWEMSNKDYRQSKQYRDWRTSVFERDGYKCQICGQVGGSLNAHHIKTFKDYPSLRFDIDNGITLCEECHREVHRQARKKKKHGKRR